jgi:hypothetical protein
MITSWVSIRREPRVAPSGEPGPAPDLLRHRGGLHPLFAWTTASDGFYIS